MPQFVVGLVTFPIPTCVWAFRATLCGRFPTVKDTVVQWINKNKARANARYT
jgi:hypothetical protein